MERLYAIPQKNGKMTTSSTRSSPSHRPLRAFACSHLGDTRVGPSAQQPETIPSSLGNVIRRTHALHRRFRVLELRA